MRIEAGYKAGTGARAAARATAAGGFTIGEGAPASRVSAPVQSAATAGIDALLALQAVEDPVLKKKKLVRRGRAMLDVLDAVKADLLAGHVAESRLNQLMALIGEARERGEPGLDSLLDDIELRARVELAKRGRFPGA